MRPNKYLFHRILVFLFTFWAYVSLHTSRQAYSNAKENMIDDWKFTKHEEGIMDAVFMFAYACGLYLSGYIGDFIDAKKVLSFGLFMTGIVIAIFGSSYPYFGVSHDYYFIVLWTLNGFVQSTGWPTSVKIMGKWFGESHAGFIFGLWSANASVGNIIGASMVSIVHSNGYSDQWMFYLPALQLVLCSLLILVFIRTEPSQWNIDVTLYDTDSNASSYAPFQHVQQEGANVSSMWNVKNIQQHVPKHDSIAPAFSKDSEDARLLSDDMVQPLRHDKSMENVHAQIQRKVQQTQTVTFMQALSLPNVITYALCYACLKSVNYTMFFWLPYFLDGVFTETVSDNLSIIYNIGQILGGWICGWISDYLHKRAPPVFAFLLLAIPPIFFLRIQSHSSVFFGILSFSAGLLIGGPANMISSAISADLGKHKSLKGNTAALATVAGIIDGTGSFGAAICQYVVALISDISWDLVFVILTVLLLCSAALLLKLTLTEIKALCKYGRKDTVDIQDQFDVNVVDEQSTNLIAK